MKLTLNAKGEAIRPPRHDQFIWEGKATPEGDTLYLGRCGDFAAYLLQTGNRHGFGGATFTLAMQDGTEKVLVGPWSSRAGCVHQLWPEVRLVELTGDDDTTCEVFAESLEALGKVVLPVVKFKDEEVYYQLAT